MQLLTPADAASRVTAALKSAAEATGAGFDYLVNTAKRESSLNASAQNPSSSARGLFQFIDSTWLEVLKEEGPRLGLGDAASHVSKTTSGRYVVADPARKAEVLALRDDPQASAMLGAAFTRRNAQAFESATGRAPSEGELYAAHFLGAQGAIELTSLASTSPNASAAAAFPSQAAANATVFYDKGRPRTARELYDRLTSAPSGSAVAAISAQARSPRSALALQSGDDVSPAPYNGGKENDGQTFHSLFKTGRRSPVASYIQQAWSAFGSAGLAADATGGTTPASAIGYAASSAPVAATARAEAGAAAVSQAARARVAKPKAPAALQPAQQPAQQPAVAAAPAPVQSATVTRRKIELTTFLGFGASAETSNAPSVTMRGRP